MEEREKTYGLTATSLTPSIFSKTELTIGTSAAQQMPLQTIIVLDRGALLPVALLSAERAAVPATYARDFGGPFCRIAFVLRRRAGQRDRGEFWSLVLYSERTKANACQ